MINSALQKTTKKTEDWAAQIPLVVESLTVNNTTRRRNILCV
jgi:hypothetical protein